MAINNLAAAIACALAQLESAALAYVAEAHRLDAEHRRGSPNPHPLLEHAADHVRHGARGRTELAKILRLPPATAGHRIAEQYE